MPFNQSVQDFRQFCADYADAASQYMEVAILEEGQRFAAVVDAAARKGKTGRLETSAQAVTGDPGGTTTDLGTLGSALAGTAGGVVTNASLAPGLDFSRVIITAGGKTTTKPEKGGRGTPYDYALATEFGTRHEHAHPFFYPSWRREKPGIEERLADKFAESQILWDQGYRPVAFADGESSGTGGIDAGVAK